MTETAFDGIIDDLKTIGGLDARIEALGPKTPEQESELCTELQLTLAAVTSLIKKYC